MKKLVAYYSLGGNKKAVAEKIDRSLRADIIEIRTVKEYPDDFDVLLGLAQKEVDSGYMPAIHPLDIDFSRYDAVILGSPVWWYSYAPALKKFISTYRWKGSHIFPFSTNGGKPGHIASDLKKALRGARVEPMLNVVFEDKRQVTSDSVLKEWAENIKTVTEQQE